MKREERDETFAHIRCSERDSGCSGTASLEGW